MMDSLAAETVILSAPVLQRLYGDWLKRRLSGIPYRIPRRSDFDPAALRYVLGRLSLFEVTRNPLRFRARVHGTNLAWQIGIEFTGKFIDEIQPMKYFKLAHAHFADVVEHRRPSFAWLGNEAMQPPNWLAEALVLPLSRDGEHVDYIFSAVVHHRQVPLDDITHPIQHLSPLPG